MNPNDLREILGLGDLVLYDHPSYAFEGIVQKIDYERDLVTVEMSDIFGVRRYDCGFERIVHLLSASALALEVETKTLTSELISVS